MDEKLQLSELRALVNAFIDDTKGMLDDLLKKKGWGFFHRSWNSGSQRFICVDLKIYNNTFGNYLLCWVAIMTHFLNFTGRANNDVSS